MLDNINKAREQNCNIQNMYQSEPDLEDRFCMFKTATCFDLHKSNFQANTISEAQMEEGNA
jgi:hypothetical protein